MDRLEFVRDFELKMPVETISTLLFLLGQFAARGARHTLQHLREYDAAKRLGIITAFLLQSLPDLTDDLIHMFTRLVGRWFNKADKKRWDVFQHNGRDVNQKLHDFVHPTGHSAARPSLPAGRVPSHNSSRARNQQLRSRA